MDDAQVHAWIVAKARSGHFYITDHALTKHPIHEFFTPNDAIRALENGSVIEHRKDECRCTICGEATGIRLDGRFHGSSIHCVVQYDYINDIVIVTMYRPLKTEWATPFRKHRR